MSALSAYNHLLEAFLLLDDGDHRLLKTFGLTPTQFAVLQRLDPVESIRPIDLAGPLLLDKSSITRVIDRLVQENLVSRAPDPDDRRAQRLVLTELGVARREQARIAFDQSIEQRMRCLTDDEQRTLGGLLAKLRDELLGMFAEGAP
ncbi:MarR family winged helix-turn-helix transcriptional regulator [Kouleothrix sp.]|uniref:MarR family winged helix-turn-helix transcriptional regulator n=1 Tax=Kouleothrix sp. TaxID=2779161 RepID=UPI00391BA348